jgi:non-specific protein-tyrosine kinase
MMRGKLLGNGRFDEHLVVLTDPKSIAAEQYRVLRSRIAHLSHERGLRTFIITSPVVGEGKSMTAANLALSLSQSRDRRVALVDCDLRRPTLHRLFGMRMREGFIDVLEERTALETALIPIEHPRLPAGALSFLPAGRANAASPEWLGSSKADKLITLLSERFDLVFFDTPPILPLADAAVLGAKVNGALLVLRAGSTSVETLGLAMQSVDLQNWVGVILNGVDFERSSQYGGIYATYQKSYSAHAIEGRGDSDD